MRAKVPESAASGELTVVVGSAANGGSCVAHHEGRVVFVRYALPGRAGAGAGHRRPRLVLARRGCRGDRAVGRPDRVAVPDRRSGRRRVLRSGVRRTGGGPGAQGAMSWPISWSGWAGTSWSGARPNRWRIPVPPGWRTRVRLDVGADRRPGFHRYHSDELVTDLRCAQLPDRNARRLAVRRLAAGRPAARGRRRRRPAPCGANPARGRADRDQGDARAAMRRCSGWAAQPGRSR